ncbi:PUF3 [Candida oxycetoniae]|uniref:Pumilio homology domain family member 3 n=1 Tax=Candida oxycetoniae TaxID=497107 RepID=A0AAI9T146_9ASCO|nr:PUF3 [Candida oxycetoniae]KAI3406664.2 PUF3 [Candida oxycetoniae]
MPTETIWSSSHSSPIQTNASLTSNPIKSHNHFKSVLDQVDSDVAKFLANSNPLDPLPTNFSERRLSFDDGSDFDDTSFGFKRGTLSAITAPVGGTNINYNAHPPQFNLSHDNVGVNGQKLNFGTVSISGGIASRHPPPQESFLQKFANVADTTREIEFGNLSLSSRRTSFIGNNSAKDLSKSLLNGGISATTKSGSLNENLNMPAPRTSRHQSISEKIDNYNNNSPIQANSALSVNSELNAPDGDLNNGQTNGTHRPQTYFWNPAAATSFTPANNNTVNYFMDNGASFALPTPPPIPPQAPLAPQGFSRQAPNQGNMPPLNIPQPFMVPSPPPPPQFLDPTMFNMVYGNFSPFPPGTVAAAAASSPTAATVPPPPPPPMPASSSSSSSLDPPDNEAKNDKSDADRDGDAKKNRDSTGNQSNQNESKEDSSESRKSKIDYQNGAPRIGVGLMNRQLSPASFMFHPFNPYSVYQQSSNMMAPEGMTSLSPQAMGMSLPPPVASVPSPIPFSQQPQPPPPPTQPQPQQEKQKQQHTQPTQPPSKSAKDFGKHGNGGHSSTTNTKKKSTSLKNKNSGGSIHIYRSPLLEEVRSNTKEKKYTLRDIYGHAVEFTKDQHGSRFIQQKLPTATDEEKEVIFNEIKDISLDLMTDVFGNYVIQKYFEHGSEVQKQILLQHMIGHVYELSLQMYGCRVVQRALESLDKVEDQLKIIEELRDYILICSKDQNGNHVIQKSIEKIKPFEKIRFILTSLENQVNHLSMHSYGCRVIQRLLEYSNKNDQKKILQELNKFIYYLIQDQYGNYVIQHILEQGDPVEKEEILEIVLKNVVNFSKLKFASNVIEKCIKHGDLEQRRRILHEVMVGNEKPIIGNDDPVSDDSPLALMMKDQYANYVIQKLVEVFDSNSPEKRQLVLKLRQYLKQLSDKNNYGGKHLASVEKMIIVAETALD